MRYHCVCPSDVAKWTSRAREMNGAIHTDNPGLSVTRTRYRDRDRDRDGKPPTVHIGVFAPDADR